MLRVERAAATQYQVISQSSKKSDRKTASRDLAHADPIAVVVGLCAHGLATSRALARNGVEVIAIEDNSALPGSKTRYAKVLDKGPVNGEGLVSTLLTLAREQPSEPKPVLFLTNDNMVREVATHWPELAPFYALSWSSDRRNVLGLLDKAALEERCDETGLLYPRSVLIESDDLNSRQLEIDFPIIVKPTRPLSSFKACEIENAEQLGRVLDEHASSLPFLAQELITGPDDSLKVCAMYMQDGSAKAIFTGSKVYSYPPGVGQTSVMKPIEDRRIVDLTATFFEGLGLSGPVSLELKEDPEGRLFVIEPTIGRSDYFIDACVSNNVNIPLIEYQNVCGSGAADNPTQLSTRVWFDTERDQSCFIRFLLFYRMKPKNWKPVFPYFRNDDTRPLLVAIYQALFSLMSRVAVKVRKLISSRNNP